MSLRSQFVLYFGLGGVFLLFVITTLVFYRMESAMELQLEQQFKVDAQKRVAGLNHSFDVLRENFESMARLPMFRSMRFHQLTLNQAALKNDIRQLELFFFDWINQNIELTQVQYVNKMGAEVFRIENKGIRQNLTDMSQDKVVSEVLKLKRGDFSITSYRINNQIQNIVWWIPIYVTTDEHYGVMGFSVDYSHLLDIVEQLVTSDVESVCLEDDQGVVLFSNHNKTTCQKQNDDFWSVTDKINLPDFSWQITLSVDSDVFQGEVKQIRLLVFGFIFPIVAILGFILAVIFSNHIVHAISQLVEAAHIMGRGEWYEPIDLDRNDELGELAEEINRSANLIEDSRNKLQEKNRDLDSYSYTLAHDLRAPLRSISSFAQILEMDAREKLSDEERDSLTRITKASQRMSFLIDDVLELARLSNRKISLQNISLEQIAWSVIEQFRRSNADRDVNVEIDKDMIVKGDPQLLRLVLENLLGNAWKYTRKSKQAEIKFGSVSQGTGSDAVTVYFIRDNGVGFDMKYVDKLFKPFQRLHKEKDYEGTGIGLASVRRMIERHEGQVWIQSVMNQGTSVFFTLWEWPEDSFVEVEEMSAG